MFKTEICCVSKGKIGWFIYVSKVGLFMYALNNIHSKIYTCVMELPCYSPSKHEALAQCGASVIEHGPTLGQRPVFAGVDLYKNILVIKIYSSHLIPYVYPL